MRAILMFVLLAASFAASAVPVPGPNPSGVYLSDDKACMVNVSRAGAYVRTYIVCVHYNSRVTSTTSDLYAPNNGCRSDAAIPLNPSTWSDFVSLREFSETTYTLRVIRGPDDGSATNGTGNPETWFMVGRASTNYTCGTNRKPRG